MNKVHVMKTFGTYFQNDKLSPLCYGEVEIENTARRRLRTEPEKTAFSAKPYLPVFAEQTLS